MNRLYTYVFLASMCLNGVISANFAQFRKALTPENIDKFKDETCYTLKFEADIQTCAMVKLLMTQALGDSYKPGRVATIGSIAGGGTCLGLTAGFFVTVLTERPGFGLIAGLIGMGGGALVAQQLHTSIGSADQQKTAEFGAYFNELIQNPTVINLDFTNKNLDAINNNVDAMNKRGAIEELFKKLCEKHNLIEKSPVFEQYRWTRQAAAVGSEGVVSLHEEEN